MCRWSLEVNSNNSVAMQLNNCDDSYHCTICEVVLRKSINHQVQGVISSSGHKTTGNCKADTAKGFRVLLAIRKVFHYLNKETFRVSYPTFVRPRLIKHQTLVSSLGRICQNEFRGEGPKW